MAVGGPAGGGGHGPSIGRLRSRPKITGASRDYLCRGLAQPSRRIRMKRSKKTTGKQAPTPDEFADAIVRKLDLNMSPYSMRRHLMHFGLPEEKAAQMAEGARRAL